MSILASLRTDNSIAEETDVLGGGFQTWDSAIYEALDVKLAYLHTAASGAMALALTLADSTGRELRQTVYMTSGQAKGLKNFYERDGKKHYLPGFLLANSLSLMITGKEIADLDTDEKVIKLFDFNASAEVPTKVQMFSELLGGKITAAVFKQVVDKNAKNDATGVYEPTGETREENEIDKFFHAETGQTLAEAKADSPAAFKDQWADKWTGHTKDRSTKNVAGTGAKAGAPGAAAGAAPAARKTSSLFK